MGKHHYRIYETRGTITLTEGKVIIVRLVPFLDGWMITTQKFISFSNVSDEWKRESYGIPIPQFTFVKKYYDDQKRLRIN